MIDNARAILSYTDITAPIAGRTGIRHGRRRQYRACLRRDRPRRDHADPADLGVVQPAAAGTARASTRASPRARCRSTRWRPTARARVDSGKVTVIDNQVDQTTGTVKLKAEFPNADLQLWPGQFVNVRLLINTLRQVVVVPTAAVQRGPNGTFVYVIKDDNKVTVKNGHDHPAGRPARGDRGGPAGGRARRHHRFRPPGGRHAGGDQQRRGGGPGDRTGRPSQGARQARHRRRQGQAEQSMRGRPASTPP